MAEAAPLSLAHRVVIDAMGFACSRIMADSWDQLVIDVMGQALPQAKPTGIAALDALIGAAAELVASARALRRAHAVELEGARLRLGMAQAKAASALAEFYRARLAQSATALLGELPAQEDETPPQPAETGKAGQGARPAGAGSGVPAAAPAGTLL